LPLSCGYVQFIKGKEYHQKAIEQLNASRRIPANRGNIYDCNGDILASSSTVYTVNINPAKISKENKAIVAKTLAEIFSLSYEEVFKKVNQNTSVVSIAKKQPKEMTDYLRDWMNQTNIYERY